MYERITNYNKLAAFTLAEVLITLLIIGIVASIIIPSLILDTKKNEINLATKSAFSLINEALRKTKIENSNVPIMCYYHAVNPYGSALCTGYNENGDCTGHTLLDGSPLPSDYNGYFYECSKLLPEMKNHMGIGKTCTSGRALIDGCMPQYKGNDQIQLDNNSSNTMYTQVDANRATSGCSGWRSASFTNKEAIVLNNGMIIIPYSTQFANSPIIGIDVNGMKPPNKAGHDLFFFYTKGLNGSSSYYPGGCQYSEPGGSSAYTILYAN